MAMVHVHKLQQLTSRLTSSNLGVGSGSSLPFSYPRKSEGLRFYRRWFVCLFVTTITWTDLDDIFWEGS